MSDFFAAHWLEIVIAILGLLAGGLVIRMMVHRQSGSSNYVNQSGVNTTGDVTGRDKITRDEAPRP